MTDDEQAIEYVYDEQGRLIAARWFEEPNVKVFEYSAADLDFGAVPPADSPDLDPLPDSTDP